MDKQSKKRYILVSGTCRMSEHNELEVDWVVSTAKVILSLSVIELQLDFIVLHEQVHFAAIFLYGMDSLIL